MGFQVTISGGSPGPHNDAVHAAIQAASAELAKVPGLTATISGYSNDGTGNLQLSGTITPSAPTLEGAAAPDAAPPAPPTIAEGPVVADVPDDTPTDVPTPDAAPPDAGTPDAAPADPPTDPETP